MIYGHESLTQRQRSCGTAPDQPGPGAAMIQSGELAALKVGREYRIPLAALEEFVQAALE